MLFLLFLSLVHQACRNPRRHVTMVPKTIMITPTVFALLSGDSYLLDPKFLCDS
jgi:hypothetical protein